MTQADLDAEWDRCAGWLDAALKSAHDERTTDDIYLDVLAGRKQFWPGEDSAIVTQLLTHANGVKECNILLAGGTLGTLEKMLVDVERFARANTASVITVMGRRGWERSFLTREAGFQPIATLYRKELDS
jgi:hypothetical protein